MKISPRETTKAILLVATDLSQPLHIRSEDGSEIWISTIFGKITLGVIGGGTYRLDNNAIIPSHRSDAVVYQVVKDNEEVS